MYVDRPTSALAAAILFCLLPAASLAKSGGIDSSQFPNLSTGCNGCHTSNVSTPVVTVTPSATLVGAGQTISVTVSLTTPNGTEGGFNLRTGGVGTFTAPSGSGAQVLSGEATHSARKSENSSGDVVFTVSWKAPTTPQTVNFIAWGNSVNSNGNNGGDRAGTASTSVQVCTLYFQDSDQDTYGGSVTQVSCTGAPTGYVTTGGDCDDTNAQVNPAGTESCNGLDDDCDTVIDDGVTTTFYPDMDQDTYGRNSGAVQGCAAPAGFVADNTDCNDLDATVNPGAQEICNGKSDDCDAEVDEGAKLTFYRDQDQDTYGNPNDTSLRCAAGGGYVGNDLDCNDANAAINPGATEVCNDVDDDCDGARDDGVALITWYVDADADGVGGPTSAQMCDLAGGYAGFSKATGDCNDGDGSIHPGAAETCDQVDEDCDGTADDAVPLASCGVGACARLGNTCEASSCTPGAPGAESCNGVDDDCDGTTDENPDDLCDGELTCFEGACHVKSVADAGTGDGGDEDVGFCSASGSSGFATLLVIFGALALLRRRRRA